MKSIYTLLALLFGSVLFAQVTSEPQEVDPESSVKIIVNLNQLDLSQEYVTNLLDSADNGADIYMWTFSPFEHPAGHPLVNGTGERAWQNSNDTLRMTKEADRIYSYTMVPTDFYEVDAAKVYEDDIKFLVKTKNGGGFGDPDVKSDDLTLAVDPPKVELDPAYVFPSTPRGDDIVSVNYDNLRETKVSMQNLAADEAFFYAEATLSDSSVVRIQPFTTVSSNQNLQLQLVEPGVFKKYIIPNDFFNVPQNLEIIEMTFIITKRSAFTGADDRVDYDIIIDLDCG
jgi:hypothetical protein